MGEQSSSWLLGIVEKMGGRKLVLAMLVAIIAGLCEAVFPTGLSTNMMTVLLGIIGTFTAGNVAEHFTKRKPAPLDVAYSLSAPEAEEADPLEAKMDGLADSLQTTNEALGFLVNYVKQAQAVNAP